MRPAFDIGLVDFQIATMDQQDSRRVFGFLFVVQPAILSIIPHTVAQHRAVTFNVTGLNFADHGACAARMDPILVHLEGVTLCRDVDMFAVRRVSF